MERENNYFEPEGRPSREDLLKNSIVALEDKIRATIESNDINDTDKKERVTNLRKTLNALKNRVTSERFGKRKK